MAVIQWDDEIGPVAVAKYPKKLKKGLDSTTLMKVYGYCTLGETEETPKPGFVSLSFDEFKVGVYYGGLTLHLRHQPSMVMLVVGPDEEPEDYKDALTEVGTKLLINAYDESYKKALKSYYLQISRYTQMSQEQRLANIIGEPVRKIILENLLSEGTISVPDVESIIQSEMGKKVDPELVLRPMVRQGIVQTGWVEGHPSEHVFLVRGLFILRTVPIDLLKKIKSGMLPKDVADKYLQEARKVHESYINSLKKNPTEYLWKDAERLYKILINFTTYDLLVKLREGPLQTDHLITLLSEYKKSDIMKAVARLEKMKLVKRISDESGNEFVLLLADVSVNLVYPRWLIVRTVERYNEGEMTGKEASHYLEMLKAFHPSNPTIKTFE